MPGQSIDHGLDEGQLNGLGIGRVDLFHSASSEQPQGLVGEAGEAQRSRCSDDLNLIFVLERVVVPDTDTFHTGTKAEDTGDQVFGWVASTAVRSDSGRMGHRTKQPVQQIEDVRAEVDEVATARDLGIYPPPLMVSLTHWAGRSLRMLTDRS